MCLVQDVLQICLLFLYEIRSLMQTGLRLQLEGALKLQMIGALLLGFSGSVKDCFGIPIFRLMLPPRFLVFCIEHDAHMQEFEFPNL